MEKKARVLRTENLPVHNDWSPQYVGQAEHVELLQTLPGLTGQRQQT